MESSQKHLEVAMATILLSTITKLCILSYIPNQTWLHRKGDVYPYVLMVKEYNDTIYKNTDCSGEELMVKSAMWEENHSIWASQYHSIYKSPY